MITHVIWFFHTFHRNQTQKKVIAVVFLGQLVIVGCCRCRCRCCCCIALTLATAVSNVLFSLFAISLWSICTHKHIRCYYWLHFCIYFYPKFIGHKAQTETKDIVHTLTATSNKATGQTAHQHMKMANKIQARNRTPFSPNWVTSNKEPSIQTFTIRISS